MTSHNFAYLDELSHRLHIFDEGTPEAKESAGNFHAFCREAESFVSYLAKQEVLADDDLTVLTEAREALVNHLGRYYAQENRGTQVSARQLYSEAERILARTAGGLSLYERLLRDPQLRTDILDLLERMEGKEGETPQLLPKGGRKKGDDRM